VLVVEDEPNQREALVRTLSGVGMTVHAVSNGIEAFDALRTEDYHVVVCDIRMPQQSGLTFYDQLEERFPHLAGRVIFVSGFTGDPETRQYLERTGQPFIQKPYDLEQLIDTVTRVMEKPFYV
jgi:CheY-like chemotaxis protein